MTIRSTFIAMCDNDICCAEVDSEDLLKNVSFDEFIDHVRSEGWKSHRNRHTGEWDHFCPEHKR